MPTEQKARSSGAFSNMLRLVIGLSLAAALIWLAFPRTISAIMNLPGDPILQAIQNGRPADNEELLKLISSRDKGLEWTDDGRAWTDQGLAYMRLAEQSGHGTAAGIGYMEAGVEALKTGLSKAPANPYAWARLSYLGLRMDGADSIAKPALIMSLFTGPFERALVDSRIQYALSIWHQLDASQQALVHDQIILLERFDRRRLYQITRQDPSYRVIALTSLAAYPERQAALRAASKK